jgi:phosphoribosylformimino-5-aminoimidazole carboxamide ribotide isomerase
VTISKATLVTLADYCDEFLVHAAHVEGMKNGVDKELIALLAEHSPIPVTYAGGVRSLADLDTVYEQGNGSIDATVGSALDIFGGKLPYKDVVAWHNDHQRGSAINRVSTR